MNQGTMFDISGRLLWKINDFQSKMNSAKEHDTVLFSPGLLSSSYGYKLRVNLYIYSGINTTWFLFLI